MECHLWCACCRADHAQTGVWPYREHLVDCMRNPSSFSSALLSYKIRCHRASESLRYEYAEKGLNFSTICPANIATPIFQRGSDGTVNDKVPIPDDAYPVDKAASYILDRVAERKGIIIVPEEPFTEMWKGYVLGDEQTEAALLQIAHDRRVSFETKGTYY